MFLNYTSIRHLKCHKLSTGLREIAYKGTLRGGGSIHVINTQAEKANYNYCTLQARGKQFLPIAYTIKDVFIHDHVHMTLLVILYIYTEYSPTFPHLKQEL